MGVGQERIRVGKTTAKDNKYKGGASCQVQEESGWGK